MSRTHLMNDMKFAAAEFTTARQKLTDARFQSRNGMKSDLAFAEMVEHNAYHRWLHASAAFIGTR